MPDRSPQLEKCARLLSSKSTDDEKLAGLLLVPKIVDAQDVESLEYLLCSMDSRFIERLLRTGLKQATAEESPEAHGSKDEGAGIPPMLNIALFVIDVFASHAILAQRPQILDRIETLCSVVSSNIPHTSSDAVQVLCKILAVDPAIERVLAHVDFLSKIVEATGHSQADSLELTQFLDYALSRCSLWLHSTPELPAQHVVGWVSLMNDISLLFSRSETILKFRLLPVLASALTPLDSRDAGNINGMAVCKTTVDSIRAGCVWIMRQRSETTDYFDQALVLASHIVRLWPQHAFAMSTIADNGSNSGPEQQEQKAAELILRLACVEGQSAIDSMMIHAPLDEKVIQMSGAVAADADRLRLGWKLPFCAELAASWLEWADEWLDAQDGSADVDEASVHSLMGEVQKLAEAVVTFAIDWKERIESERAMMDAGPEIVASVIHLLGRWLATDTKLHNRAMPILAMCANWIDQSRYGQVVKEYMRPSVSFALETCEVDEAQYVDDLRSHRLQHKARRTQDLASPWVGTIEFDDLARAVYGIPSDEEMLRRRQEHGPS
ncbi:hypothetical protein LPJ59_003387 [Coemansia sp. RSA 2399]|nr:hypothetical protein LPJ59_003387 [Coemansia sp. RSA 2399]